MAYSSSSLFLVGLKAGLCAVRGGSRGKEGQTGFTAAIKKVFFLALGWGKTVAVVVLFLSGKQLCSISVAILTLVFGGEGEEGDI